MSNIYTAQELKKRIESNDNRCTAMPYLLLLQEKQTYIAHDDYAYDYEEKWVEHYSGDCLTADTREELILKLKENYCDEWDDLSKEVESKIESFKEGHYWKTENVFLTDKGYQDHLKENSHNLKEHRTYGTHAFRNKEIRSLYALIDESINLQKENQELRRKIDLLEEFN